MRSLALMAGLAGALAGALAGCAVGPDFHPPAAPSAAGYTAEPLAATAATDGTPLGPAQHFAAGAPIQADWWRLFGSEPLDGLVATALQANPSIAAGRAALRQAEELKLAQQGAWFPQVAAGYSASANKTATATLSPATQSGSAYYALHTAQVTVSFVPDVFGQNARSVEALAAQADNQRYQLVATRLTLAANVVAAAIQEAALRGQVAAVHDAIDAEAQALTILRRQLALGQVAGSDVAAQETALAQAAAALPPLDKQLAQQHDLLAALLGRMPAEAPAVRFELASLALPTALPVRLPADLVRQRPDVLAAEAALHAASAEIGVAIANRLPQLSLTADLGGQSSQLATLFASGGLFGTLAGGVTQPIFQGGTLLHRQRAAEAAFVQAEAQYRSVVISACQNVADALRALRSDADALRTAVAAERAADRTMAITRQQLALGQVAYLALLNAENAYQQTRLARVQAEAARLTDTVALFQALGGGWGDDRQQD